MSSRPIGIIPSSAESYSVLFWLDSSTQENLLSDPEGLIQRLKTQPRSLGAREFFEWACACEFLGNILEAKRLWKLSLQVEFGYFPSLYALSLYSFQESKHQEAKRFLKRALRLDEAASESMIFYQKKLRQLLPSPESILWGSWSLEEVGRLSKDSDSTKFELAKILFEQSRYSEAQRHFEVLVDHPEFSFESSQYLSYLYERLYQGDELIQHYLQLIRKVSERADLLFNLGMIFQNYRSYALHSLQFFFLAHRDQPEDPGLRFSLEQACMDQIGRVQEAKNRNEFVELLFAHLYYGATPVAERYARVLKDRWNWKFPQSLSEMGVSELWEDWLCHKDHPTFQKLSEWFSDTQAESTKIQRQDS